MFTAASLIDIFNFAQRTMEQMGGPFAKGKLWMRNYETRFPRALSVISVWKDKPGESMVKPCRGWGRGEEVFCAWVFRMKLG